MEEKVKVKNSKILDYFSKMKYGENMENLNKAEEWFRAKEKTFFAYVDKTAESPNGIPTILQNHTNAKELCKISVPEIDTIKKILIKCSEKSQWFEKTPMQRRNILIKLSTEIEKNADLFAQIEIMSRGILGSDTKKWSILLIVQYFQYYAHCISSMKTNSDQKPGGVAVGVFSNKNSLSNLGVFLAPALAAGYNVILHVGTELAPVAFLLINIARSVGIPEDVLRLIPSDDGELLPYLSSEKVAILALFIDLQNETYRGFNSSSKKILNFSSNKIPTIILDDADLDSACENLIEASWGYQSLLPWSTNTVLVQENILPALLNKLKAKMRSLKMGPAHNKMADIAHRDEAATMALSYLVNLARSQGVETFQVEDDCNTWNPTLFIGAKVRPNNVLSTGSDDGDEVTVLAFRSIEEAINLANNTRQGLAASVWSENIGVVNEIMRKLDVCNVWVNSFGIISPDVTLCPLKESGIGYFGGIEGLLEYTSYKRKSPVVTNFSVNLKPDVAINSVVASAKKSQENWSRKSLLEKRQIFLEFAEYLDSLQHSKGANFSDWINFAIESIHESTKGANFSDWIDYAIESIYESIADTYRDRVNLAPSFNLVSLRQPRGVISVDVSESNNAALIFSALFSGNAVILSCESAYLDVFKKLGSLLPSGVFNILPYNIENMKAIAANKLVAVHFGNGNNSVLEYLPISDSKAFMTITEDMEDIYNKVTVVKNVWYDSGKSSNCK